MNTAPSLILLLSIAALFVQTARVSTAHAATLKNGAILIDVGEKALLGGIARSINDEKIFTYNDSSKQASCRVNIIVDGELGIGPGQTLAMDNAHKIEIRSGSLRVLGSQDQPAQITAIESEQGDGFSLFAGRASKQLEFRHARLSYCGKKTGDKTRGEQGFYHRGGTLIIEHTQLTNNYYALISTASKAVVRHCLLVDNCIGISLYGNESKDVVIENNEFRNNTTRAIVIAGASGARIENNTFTDGKVAGIVLVNASNNRFINNRFRSVHLPIWEHESGICRNNRYINCITEACNSGLRLRGSGSLVKSCTFRDYNRPVMLRAKEVEVINSEYNCIVRRKPEAKLAEDGAPLKIIDCRFAGALCINGRVIVKRHLNIEVVDEKGQPVADAIVRVEDKNRAQVEGSPFTTGKQGKCARIPCCQYVQGDHKTSYTPHYIVVEKDGREMRKEIVMDEEKGVTLELEM